MYVRLKYMQERTRKEKIRQLLLPFLYIIRLIYISFFSFGIPLFTEEIPFYNKNRSSFVYQFYPSLYVNVTKIFYKTLQIIKIYGVFYKNEFHPSFISDTNVA